MYKDFKSNFAPLCEEMTTRMQSGGWLIGDIVKILDSAFKHPKLKEKPSQFMDRLKELQGSDYPLRLCALKTEKPVSSYDGVASAGVTTGEYADIAQMISPAMWSNPITLPVDCLELVDNGANLPAYAQSQKYDNKEQIEPVEVKIKDKDILKQTENDKEAKMTAKKDTKNSFAKEPKDGRKQAKKAVKKESVYLTQFETENELIAEAYNTIERKG